MSEDLHMTSLQIFFSACPELEVSKGLYNKSTFYAFTSQLPGRAAPAKLKCKTSSQAGPVSGISGSVRNGWSSTSLCGFSRAFHQGCRRRAEQCPSLVWFVPRVNSLAEFKPSCISLAAALSPTGSPRLCAATMVQAF